jgi:hypothetical protein
MKSLVAIVVENWAVESVLFLHWRGTGRNVELREIAIDCAPGDEQVAGRIVNANHGVM